MAHSPSHLSGLSPSNLDSNSEKVPCKDDCVDNVNAEFAEYPFWKSVWNIGLLSSCFGIGYAMLFVNVSTTTVAAHEWGGTGLSTLPYGK